MRTELPQLINVIKDFDAAVCENCGTYIEMRLALDRSSGSPDIWILSVNE